MEILNFIYIQRLHENYKKKSRKKNGQIGWIFVYIYGFMCLIIFSFFVRWFIVIVFNFLVKAALFDRTQSMHLWQLKKICIWRKNGFFICREKWITIEQVKFQKKLIWKIKLR